MPDQNINDNFFDGSYKDVWKYLIPDGLTQAETDFIIEISQLKKGSKILDIMSGYGRHSLELGRREMNVTAIDNLDIYIEEIIKNVNNEKLPVKAYKENVSQLSDYGIQDLIICMGNSFGFFNYDEACQLMNKISGSLKNGGYFILNSWVIAEIAIRHFREKEWYYSGPFKCLLDSKFLWNPSRIECEQTIIAPDGKVEIIKGIDYVYSISDLTEMAKISGLQLQELYSTPRKKKFVFGDTRVYIVFKKAG